MTRDDFWKHIEKIDRDALAAGDEDAAIAPLEDSLKSLAEADLKAYEEHLSQFLYALDGKIFADEAGESGGSDDCFLYARCYVVASGRKQYEATLKNPKLMPKSIDQWCEALLYPHRRAWAELVGKDEDEWAFDASVSYESGSNEAQWPK